MRGSLSISGRVLLVLLTIPWFGAQGLRADAATNAPIAGEYICASGCRLTDAAPSVEIDGRTAHCMNELGGTYSGRLLSDRSVACFNKTGVLSEDGKTILWSDGVTWKRR